MELRSSGDDNSHWFHLSGVVVEKTFDTLLIELNEKEESSLFFDTTKVSLDCTKCKGDLEQVSEGNVIKFYFFNFKNYNMVKDICQSINSICPFSSDFILAREYIS